MSTWFVAFVSGGVGSVLTAALAFCTRIFQARREIDGTDRFVADRDADLASWVVDRHRALERELAAKSVEMNKSNLFHSSAHGRELALIKERALYEYRDQRRQAERDVALAKARETWLHKFWRRLRDRPFPKLTAPERAQPLLDAWRSPITRHKGSEVEIADPTQRTLDQAIQDAQRDMERFV